MDKKILSKNENCVIYTDYSIKVKCSKCGKEDFLKSDHKMAIRINQITGSEKNYLCIDCWRKGQEREIIQDYNGNDRREEIMIGQSINLGNLAALLLHTDELEKDITKLPELLEKYSKSYLEIIKKLYK